MPLLEIQPHSLNTLLTRRLLPAPVADNLLCIKTSLVNNIQITKINTSLVNNEFKRKDILTHAIT